MNLVFNFEDGENIKLVIIWHNSSASTRTKLLINSASGTGKKIFLISTLNGHEPYFLEERKKWSEKM